MNLTAIHDVETIRVKHFLDSLTCLKVMRDSPMDRIIDVGTGAGFPGIPLKIACPSMRLTLVESIRKKGAFCKYIVQKMHLSGVLVLSERAEVIGHQENHREQYDWAVARAVARLVVLVEYLLPLVHVGGSMLAMKGESAIAEAHEAEQALRILGGHIRCLVPVTLPGVVEDRYLVLVDKVAATPKEYPRRTGIPAKRPLL
jgi:16S rRNA (guanine527-N7)-methyltransferase